MASDVNGAIEVQAEVQAVRRMKNVTFVTANLRRRIEKFGGIDTVQLVIPTRKRKRETPVSEDSDLLLVARELKKGVHVFAHCRMDATSTASTAPQGATAVPPGRSCEESDGGTSTVQHASTCALMPSLEVLSLKVIADDDASHASSADQWTIDDDDGVGVPLHSTPSETERDLSAVACYLVLTNISKKHNLSQIIRSAGAFGVAQIVLVGRRGVRSFCKKSGSGWLPIKHVSTLVEAQHFLKTQPHAVHICGVEITDEARSLHDRPFCGATAFVIGNERSGLSKAQMDICDSFVYIPQFGGSVGSLNVSCATTVVLYEFSAWAAAVDSGGHWREPSRSGSGAQGRFVLSESRAISAEFVRQRQCDDAAIRQLRRPTDSGTTATTDEVAS